jgi:hydrogenase expression/formation protein HypC
VQREKTSYYVEFLKTFKFTAALFDIHQTVFNGITYHRILIQHSLIERTVKASSMCLGIPMKVVHIEGFIAQCEAKGVERQVNLFMMQDEPLSIGDFVMVHVGYAIQKMSAEEAHSAWELFDQALAMEGST